MLILPVWILLLAMLALLYFDFWQEDTFLNTVGFSDFEKKKERKGYGRASGKVIL